MNIEIVPDNHVALLERGGELGVDVGVELVAVHGPIDNKGCSDGIATQAGDEGLGVPFAKRSIGLQTLASFASPTQRRHVGLNRSLIDEDQTARALLHRRLAMLAPFIAFPAHIDAFAFRCQQCFFYK